jgi:hypothetical protein
VSDPVAAGVVAAAASVAAASVPVAGVAASLTLGDASNPLGSLPTLEVTGGAFAVGSVVVLAGGAASAGPYELVVTGGGCAQLRLNAMAPTLGALVVGAPVAPTWRCVVKNWVGTGRAALGDCTGRCVARRGNCRFGRVSASSE